MAAPTNTSMAGKKRKLADLSVDEFMMGGFESSSSESDKSGKRSKNKKGKDKDQGKKNNQKKIKQQEKGKSIKTKGVVTSHKSSLEKLKAQDPEFYEFLKDEDESLLKFGDMSGSDMSDSSDDDDASKSDDIPDSDNDEEDIELPESSDEDSEETEKNKKKMKISEKKKSKKSKADKENKTGNINKSEKMLQNLQHESAKQKKEKTTKQEKSKKTELTDTMSKQSKKKRKKIEEVESDDEGEEVDDEFDMDTSDESDDEGMLHKLPDMLEEMSGSDSDDDIDDDDGGDSKTKKGSKSIHVTMRMVKEWTKRFKDQPSPSVLHEAVYAFKAAVQHTASRTVVTRFKVEGGKVFNSVVRMCLVEIPQALQKILDLPATTDLQKPVLPSAKNQKWKKVRLDIKSYLADVLQLMSDLSDANMVNVLLKHIHKLVAFYSCYPKLTKAMLKKVVNVWSTGEETSRVLAFLCVNRIIRIKQEELLESCIKQLYMAYVKNCKFTSPNTLPLINFMQRSLVEIFSLDFGLAYQYAFIYIRQLAIHLRNAISTKKKESCQAVYNWQYVHCIGLWSRVMSMTYPNVVMEPLIYPLVQTIVGTIKLIPTQRYYPLRFHCVKALTMISSATNTFIPVLPFLLEVFEQTDFNKKHKAISFKPFNFACILKLSKTQLQEKSFKDGVIDQLYELLLEHFHVHAHTIGFPELALPAILQMKEFLKKCKVGNFTKQIKQIVDKVDENSKFITARRRSTTISLSDTKAIIQWERMCETSGTPLGKFYTTWRKLRDRELMHQIAARDQIVGDDGLPQLVKPKGPQRATDDEKKEFSALFDSDSDDNDQDLTDRFLPPDEKKKLKKEKKQTNKRKEDSDSDDDYSDFDSDDLEQLAGSAPEDSDDDEDIEMDDGMDNESDDDDDDDSEDVTKEVNEEESDDEGAEDIVQEFTMSSDDEDD